MEPTSQPTETPVTPHRHELVESIVADPDQPRKTFQAASLDELALNIWDNGLTQPIVVTPEPEGGVFKVFVGERRLRAFQINHRKALELLEADPKLPEGHPAWAYESWTRIPVVVEPPMPADIRLLRQIDENDQRSGISLYERAYAYWRALKASGLKSKEFCARHRIAPALMSTYTTLVNAKGATKLALESGLFQDADAARVFVQLPLPHQESLIADAQENETLLTRVPLQKVLDLINQTAALEEKAAAEAAAAAAAAGKGPQDGAAARGPEGEGGAGGNQPAATPGAAAGDAGDNAAGKAPDNDLPPSAGPVLYASSLYWLQHHLETLRVEDQDEPHRLQALDALTEAVLHESALLVIRDSVDELMSPPSVGDESPEGRGNEPPQQEQPQA